MPDGPLAPRRRAGATTDRAPLARRIAPPPVTAVVVAILGGGALGAACTAVLREGRAVTLAAFGVAQVACGLALIAAGLVLARIAMLSGLRL